MAVAGIYVAYTDRTMDPNMVTMDFSRSVAELTDPETTMGFAFTQTLGHLGFEHCLETSGDWLPRMIVYGSLEAAQARLARLHGQIETIAAGSMARSRSAAIVRPYEREHVGQALDKLVQHTIPQAIGEAGVAELLFKVAYPFGKGAHDAGVTGHIDSCKAPWRASQAEQDLKDKRLLLLGEYGCIPLRPEVPAEEELARLSILESPRWLD